MLRPTKTCFLIDDDQDDQHIFRMALNEIDENITCFFAKDGHEGFSKLRNDILFRPDYIFVDMNMPRMNGVECLTAIKTIDRLKEVPVFIYSTHGDRQIINNTKLLGASDYIVKPFTIDKLTDILRQCFNRF